jgi:hypothetical protein
LDFLGFSRPNLDLSMGYPAQSEQKVFSALLPWREAPEGELAVGAMRKRRNAHGGKA